MSRNYDCCPNCGIGCGIEEMSFQECDCCGYPDNMEDYNDCGMEDYDEYDSYCYEGE